MIYLLKGEKALQNTPVLSVIAAGRAADGKLSMEM
jgi:hypothetical protein